MIERSTPNWPPFLWHHRVHHDLAGEQLMFYRISFAPVYERDLVADGIRAAYKLHGIRSVVSYELLGSYDLLLRVWVPKDTKAKTFMTTLTNELAPHGAQVIEPFAVTYTLRHFLFPQAEGEPQFHDIHHLQPDEIKAVETGYPDKVPDGLLERLAEQKRCSGRVVGEGHRGRSMWMPAQQR